MVLPSLACILIPQFLKMTCEPPINTLVPWEEDGAKDREQGQRFKRFLKLSLRSSTKGLLLTFH